MIASIRNTVRRATRGTMRPRIAKPLDNLGVSLILAVAFGASIGGVGIMIGTPPMAQMAGFVKTTYGQEMTFLEWMKIGVPVLIVFVAVCWVSLTKVCFPVRLGSMPGVRRLIGEELRGLGRMNRGERATLIVFAGAALLWVAAPLVGAWVKRMPEGGPLRDALWFTTRLSDAGIAMAAALRAVHDPGGRSKDGRAAPARADVARGVAPPVGILILFGGGLSLAEAVKTTGLDKFIAGQFGGMEHVPVLAVMFAMAAVCVFLTELTSNTAAGGGDVAAGARAGGEAGCAARGADRDGDAVGEPGVHAADGNSAQRVGVRDEARDDAADGEGGAAFGCADGGAGPAGGVGAMKAGLLAGLGK